MWNKGVAQRLKVPILYEDNHLLLVEKPVNMPVQADQSEDLDLLNYLKNDIKDRYQKPGNVYLGLVHRLDRPVGGMMVFAKTSKAAARLSDVIRRQAFERTYLVVVWGEPPHNQANLEHFLWKDKAKNHVYAVPSTRKHAKIAQLSYQCMAKQEPFSLLKVQLQTGRSHQIRVQLSETSMPIYGDQKYGKKSDEGQQIALWAHSLRFKHPTQAKMVEARLAPPQAYPWSLFVEGDAAWNKTQTQMSDI